ncbi:hypothetical protein OpiT1DRAFT_05281 [Opitutaceae bacterium TAV1]|nr:hypothetical protein OpiT1DRAFT_05281 [Opitutaceae bacterium TAV1]
MSNESTNTDNSVASRALLDGNTEIGRALRRLGNFACGPNDTMIVASGIVELRGALSNLLNTSAVIKSDEDFTEITCVNKHYDAAYAVLRKYPDPSNPEVRGTE